MRASADNTNTKNSTPEALPEFQHVFAGNLFLGFLKFLIALLVFGLGNLFLGEHKLNLHLLVPVLAGIMLTSELFSSALFYYLQRKHNNVQPGTKWNYFIGVVFSLAVGSVLAWVASHDLITTGCVAATYPTILLVEALWSKPWGAVMTRAELRDKWEETKVVTREHFKSGSDPDSNDQESMRVFASDMFKDAENN